MAELLTGDLYHFQDLLSDEERVVVERVRAFLQAEVTPIANDYWARAEFPFQLVKGYAELGIAGREQSSLLSGWLSLEMAHADPSMATFFGVHSGLAMGSITTCGSPEQRVRRHARVVQAVSAQVEAEAGDQRDPGRPAHV